MPKTPTPDLFDRAIAALDRVRDQSSDYDLNPGVTLPEGRKLHPAGVLVAVERAGGEWKLYLTKRSSRLRHHPGQVAFPGGKQDPGDPDIAATALREAEEEIGLPPGQAEICGTLPAHETVTSFRVTPVVVRLTSHFDIRPQEAEVEEVFTVPLAHVLDPARYQVQSRRWRGARRHYFVVPYGPYYIWGATARMLRGWADAVHDAG